jgi:ADP-heptose:LPS heptosyltransferase
MRPLAALLALAYGRPVAARAEPRKVLLIRRNGIGDMICALPLLRRIRAGFPRARLDVLASERNACILENLPIVDRVLVYRRGQGLRRNHYFNLPRVARPIRAEGYDVVVAITGGFSKLIAVITYATGVPRRVGFIPAAGHALDFCFNLAVPQPSVREHQIERCLRLAEPLGLSGGEIDVSFALRAEHESFAAQTIAAQGLRKHEYVLYNASSSRPESSWTPSAIARTAAELKRRRGLRLLPCGIAQDRAALEEIGLPYVVTPTVQHFAALVRDSLFLMCSDGGAMHVAASMKTPAFVLFASADPETWRPWGVPFGYVRSGSRVDELAVEPVLEKLEQWLAPMQQMGRRERI